MKIILLERVAKLGRAGDVVSVRAGHARNHLLPRRKALRATEANIAYFQTQRAEIEARNLKEHAHAEDVAAAMEGKILISIQQAGESGQLYGSVNARAIAGLLAGQGFSIPHGRVLLDAPIKTLGLHPVRVEIHGDVAANISVNVARSEEEAARQNPATQERDEQEQAKQAEDSSAPAEVAAEAEAEEGGADAGMREIVPPADADSPASDSEEENRVA